MQDAVRQCRMRLAKLGSRMLSVCGYLVSTSKTAENSVSTSFAAADIGSCDTGTTHLRFTSRPAKVSMNANVPLQVGPVAS